ncbi:hypothetical protein QVD99_000254 [Batrachochytrium dendrobatidis]|nr:hypothetical protein QVD99_000254 [Batrachochytrium dendrobatidis]
MSVSAKNASTDFSTNTKEALTLMHNQTKFYAIVEIKNRPYHVAKNDVIIVPRMNDLQIGDVITLDRVREMGSPDYIMQGNPYLDPRYYTIQATAIEHTVGKAIERKHRKRSGISNISIQTELLMWIMMSLEQIFMINVTRMAFDIDQSKNPTDLF